MEGRTELTVLVPDLTDLLQDVHGAFSDVSAAGGDLRLRVSEEVDGHRVSAMSAPPTEWLLAGLMVRKVGFVRDLCQRICCMAAMRWERSRFSLYERAVNQFP